MASPGRELPGQSLFGRPIGEYENDVDTEDDEEDEGKDPHAPLVPLSPDVLRPLASAARKDLQG